VSEDLSVKKHKVDGDPEFRPPRQFLDGFLLAAIVLALGLTCSFLFVGPVLIAMAAVKVMAELGESVGTILSGLAAVMCVLLSGMMARVMELLWLLQMGDPIRFLVRLMEILSN
jgi:hypothetical protein